MSAPTAPRTPDPLTSAELNRVIADLRAKYPISDGPHAVCFHEFLDIDPDLADRDYTTTSQPTEAAQ
ncbi:hypothetical protein ACWGCW_00450 [Streptomyces sp. NPDC054933]